MTVYAERVTKLTSWLTEQNIDVAVLMDWEDARNSAVRYLSGMPGDANLLVFADGRTALLPWDEILAAKMGVADQTIPFGRYSRDLSKALEDLLPPGANSIEISGGASYLTVEKLKIDLPKSQIICRADGLDDMIERQRMIKDSDEIGAHLNAAQKTNRIIDALEEGIKTHQFPLEVDIAMFIESEARKLGAGGTSFETIVAGPKRSFGIHAFPSYGGGPFATEGMSIVDFGLTVDGYASDVTFTVLSGSLSEKQEEMISLVRNAYDLAIGMAAPGAHTSEIAKAVDDLFAARNYTMPHSLGHGIGLDVHEAPVLKGSVSADAVLVPGMLFTIEPGLYDEEAGGVRYENDVLITADGAEVITTSRLISLP